MSPNPCPKCHLPTNEPVLDRECPFCQTVFSRVDGARRHAKRCPKRDGRDVHPAQRGRKRLSCDRCARVKVHCNARTGTPCAGCKAKKVECSFSRYCSCNRVPSTDRVEAARSHDSLPREGVAPLSFLLNATDDSQDFVTEQTVGTEPDGDLLGPIRRDPPQASASDEDMILEFIDPTLLLSSSVQGPPPFGSDLHNRSLEEDVLSTLLTSRSHEDKLISRIRLLEAHIAAHAHSNGHHFDSANFRNFFSISNVYKFATTFCRKRHYRYPVIHWPTFALEEASIPLLLVVCLTGASYSYRAGHDVEHLKTARSLYPLADSYVFDQLAIFLNQGVDVAQAIDILQAALLMYGLDTLLTGDAKMQHTALTKRLPSLVSAIRRLHFGSYKHSASEDWNTFIRHGSIIRIVAWTFCADCLATLSYNNPPLFSMFEMIGDLPCDPALWDADCQGSFELLRSSRQQAPSHSLKDLMSAFIGARHATSAIDLDAIPLYHLHVVLCAFQPLVFDLHVTFALLSQAPRLLRAFEKWLRLWDIALAKIPAERRGWLGVARDVPAVAFLSRRIVEVASRGEDENCHYLQRIPGWSMRPLHEFIRDFVAERGEIPS